MSKSFDLLPANTSPKANERFILQVLSILTSATVEVKRGKTGEFVQVGISFLTHRSLEKIFKQLAGKNEVDKALQKLHESAKDTSVLKDLPTPSANLITGTPAGTFAQFASREHHPDSFIV
jgi:hypothetical protein